jgi:hypothetical protein
MGCLTGCLPARSPTSPARPPPSDIYRQLASSHVPGPHHCASPLRLKIAPPAFHNQLSRFRKGFRRLETTGFLTGGLPTRSPASPSRPPPPTFAANWRAVRRQMIPHPPTGQHVCQLVRLSLCVLSAPCPRPVRACPRMSTPVPSMSRQCPVLPLFFTKSVQPTG